MGGRIFYKVISTCSSNRESSALRRIHGLSTHLASSESSKAVSQHPSHQYISPAVLKTLDKGYYDVPGVPGLRVAPGLVEGHPPLSKPVIDSVTPDEGYGRVSWESPSDLQFACSLYDRIKDAHDRVLAQRQDDTAFIRKRTAELEAHNAEHGLSIGDDGHRTIIGEKDASGRVVVGRLSPGDANFTPVPADFKVSVPANLQAPHVTLFGPHQDPKMARYAVNALGTSDPQTPLLNTLVSESSLIPKWGADGEDSVTPNAHSNLEGQVTLAGAYQLIQQNRVMNPDDKSAQPIKRIPGIALPDPKHLYNGEAMPMHLLEFAAHLRRHQHNPDALRFYVPKLETEEEAAYLNTLISTAENMIIQENEALNKTKSTDYHRHYEKGTVKLILVLETARATFRMKEMAHALKDYFIGGSLGWHDYLASAATIFEGVPSYQIPVKSDPNIVQAHIRESHELLAREMDAIGAVAIGGMYGILPVKSADPAETKASYDTAMKGYVKDVVAQLHRGLKGFWVAHPQFVRLGIGLVDAFQQDKVADSYGQKDSLLFQLIDEQFQDKPDYVAELKGFIRTVDRTPGLDPSDPNYDLAVLAANLKTSTVRANNDPGEVRYNISQTLEYMTSWFMGTGAVALPTTLKGSKGEAVPVRVMDDLATTERSCRQLWAELQYARFSSEDFIAILKGEKEAMLSRQGSAEPAKQLDNHKWLEVATHLLLQFVTSPEPVKNITELMLLATVDQVTSSDNPLAVLKALDPEKYALPVELERQLHLQKSSV